jgi:hypothetical protein
MVTMNDWAFACQSIKEQCSGSTKGLISELNRRFIAQKVMNARSIVYLQYWLQLDVATTIHVAI